MKRPLLLICLPLLLAACTGLDSTGTIAQLRNRKVEIRAEKIEGGLDKAMQSYERFLEETPESALVPEAIRRLADLKVEKEYGLVTASGAAATEESAQPLDAPGSGTSPHDLTALPTTEPPRETESEGDFEKRATLEVPTALATSPVEGEAALSDLEKAGPLEAVALYSKLLAKYPQYERNDQVLYQMSRAYEELGRVEEAMKVMDRVVRNFPDSRYLAEVQFRRAEYFFSHRRYLDAEQAYASIVNLGVGTDYYQLALYKLGWTFYKQELYEEALQRFIALLDYKVSVGYDFDQTGDEVERKRTDDTFRVISLGFSYLGGANAAVDYFARYGSRVYEDSIYANLAEYYFVKRRYSDAVATYSAFVERNAFHRKAPQFHMRMIEINMAGGFPTLVIEAKKSFATSYGLKAGYWQFFEPAERPEVLADLKTNLTDLANHYHALYQNPKRKEEKTENFAEALTWYRQFLDSFPAAEEAPVINYQVADLLLENGSFGQAAVEYEKTAYAYPLNAKSDSAGYAAVYAYRQQLDKAPKPRKEQIKREAVRSSLKFAETFPDHEKAAIVLGAAADDLYAMEEFDEALFAAQTLIDDFPAASAAVERSAWLVVAHASYELELYADAEVGYLKVLKLLPAEGKVHAGLMDNLAASIYKQGEAANASEDFRTAADHFLRVAAVAPTSKIRPNAEFDAATALIRLKDWPTAASVLHGFRTNFPGHELQPEVTKKIAYVYREDGQHELAAAEFERIERESSIEEVRREALQTAAELYLEVGNSTRALAVYRRYADSFPQPVEPNIETRHKIADLLKAQGAPKDYLAELRRIVTIDAAAGEERNDRTRYLAARAALVLAEDDFERFTAVRLVKPFKDNLAEKQKRMKTATRGFNRLLDYADGEVTAAATYYLAEIYADFSKALMDSERPELTFDDYTIVPGDNLSKIAKRFNLDIGRIAKANNLNTSNVIVVGKVLKIPRGLYPEELEQYELALEDQAFPFEEKAIAVHQSNLELITRGIYNPWIELSLAKLAVFLPARYARTEEQSDIITGLESYSFVSREAPPEAPTGEAAAEGTEEPEAIQPQTEVGNETPAELVPALQSPATTAVDAEKTAEKSAATPAAVPLEQGAEPVSAQRPAEEGL